MVVPPFGIFTPVTGSVQSAALWVQLAVRHCVAFPEQGKFLKVQGSAADASPEAKKYAPAPNINTVPALRFKKVRLPIWWEPPLVDPLSGVESSFIECVFQPDAIPKSITLFHFLKNLMYVSSLFHAGKKELSVPHAQAA